MVNGYVKYGESAVYIMEGGDTELGGLPVCLYIIMDVNHRIAPSCVCLCEGQWSTGTLNIGGMVYLYIMGRGKPRNGPTASSKPKLDCFLLIPNWFADKAET